MGNPVQTRDAGALPGPPFHGPGSLIAVDSDAECSLRGAWSVDS